MLGHKYPALTCLEKLMTFYNENIPPLYGANDDMTFNQCEAAIPRVFQRMYEIIKPELIKAGYIKETAASIDVIETISNNIILLQ